MCQIQDCARIGLTALNRLMLDLFVCQECYERGRRLNILQKDGHRNRVTSWILIPHNFDQIVDLVAFGDYEFTDRFNEITTKKVGEAWDINLSGEM
jgi:hypothetical protein